MRVWELAEELHVLSSHILELIRPYDPYIESHLAAVPRQALDAILASPPTPVWKEGEYYRWHKPPPGYQVGSDGELLRAGSPPNHVDSPWAASPASYRNRRPGPKPVTFAWATAVDDHDSAADSDNGLHRQPIWSTRDVATYYGVQPATVRKWVARGHLKPSGQSGPSHTFEPQSVMEAVAMISERRRPPGVAAPGDGTQISGCGADREPREDAWRHRRTGATSIHNPVELGGLGTRALDRLTKVHPNHEISTSQAATLLGLAPSTIRSWVKRGHLDPSAASTPRRLRFRVADIYRAARRK